MRRRPFQAGWSSRRRTALAAGIAAVLALAGGAVLVRDALDDAASPGASPAAGPAADALRTPAATTSPRTAAEQPQPVVAGERRVRRPVALDQVAHFGTGLDLRVIGVEPVHGVAEGPGEVAGPAVRLTVSLTNRGDREISLEGVVLAVSYGPDRTPAMSLSGPGGRPFGGALAPGHAQRARYVFALPTSARDHVQVVASYTGSVPGVALTGSMS